MDYIIYSKNDFAKMRNAGAAVAHVLKYIEQFVVIGISTEELDEICTKEIIKIGGKPACLGFHGYPKSICTSINNVICHGIPSKEDILSNGDIVNIDITVEINGWHGDASRMFMLGDVSYEAKNLVRRTYNSMMTGIAAAKVGKKIGDIGYAIQSYIENFGYSVVRDFCGHGIGRSMHEAPYIMHYGKPGTGLNILPGMCFTIEPMINMGSYKSVVLSDGWTAVTADGSLSAQFEHTIGINEDGNIEIFTLLEDCYE